MNSATNKADQMFAIFSATASGGFYFAGEPGDSSTGAWNWVERKVDAHKFASKKEAEDKALLHPRFAGLVVVRA